MPAEFASRGDRCRHSNPWRTDRTPGSISCAAEPIAVPSRRRLRRDGRAGRRHNPGRDVVHHVSLMATRRHQVIVAPRDHARRGVSGTLIMANHGKRPPLAQMSPGDGILTYSPTTSTVDGIELFNSHRYRSRDTDVAAARSQSLAPAQPRLAADIVESLLPRDRHGGFGERPGETDREQAQNRAPGRLNQSPCNGPSRPSWVDDEP